MTKKGMIIEKYDRTYGPFREPCFERVLIDGESYPFMDIASKALAVIPGGVGIYQDDDFRIHYFETPKRFPTQTLTIDWWQSAGGWLRVFKIWSEVNTYLRIFRHHDHWIDHLMSLEHHKYQEPMETKLSEFVVMGPRMLEESKA